MPRLDFNNTSVVQGYNNAYMIERVLDRCGDDLTRENPLRQATTLRRRLAHITSALSAPRPRTSLPQSLSR
jgi:hypothetical protein